MRASVVVTVCAACACAAGLARADENDLKAIKEGGAAFVAAYNAKDAKALGALWAENADYRDDTGLDYHGRDAIQRAYAAIFAEHPEWKLSLTLESSRLVTPSLAIEDGIAVISPPPAGPPGPNRYTATLVRQDGKWLIASVREWRVDVASNYSHLRPLEWLIGTWVAKSPGRATETTFAWSKGKNLIKRTFKTTTSENGKSKVTTGTQVVGYDPNTDSIRSWLFDSDDGFAESVWSIEENRLIGHTTSLLSDGSTARSTDILTRVSNDEFSHESTSRTIDGESVEDGDVIRVVRVGASGSPAKPK